MRKPTIAASGYITYNLMAAGFDDDLQQCCLFACPSFIQQQPADSCKQRLALLVYLLPVVTTINGNFYGLTKRAVVCYKS
jgi:hypothetical protein